MPTHAPLYQLELTLQEIQPLIWRRLIVPPTLSLPRLHAVLQIATGWRNEHLHAFEVGQVRFGTPDPEFPDTTLSERRVRLENVLHRPGDHLEYEYDFGDGWLHRIVLEEVIDADLGVSAIRCLAGARACPPEDCGGVGGYEELLQQLSDPQDPEHDTARLWAGADFDPEAFDVDLVNSRLYHYARRIG